jgi:Cu(I)/Ag(I) efflux system membrane fusion protein
MSQLQQVINAPARASLTITGCIYSNYAGHIHEASVGGSEDTSSAGMKDIETNLKELSLKEGMYQQKASLFL